MHGSGRETVREVGQTELRRVSGCERGELGQFGWAVGSVGFHIGLVLFFDKMDC